MVGIGDFSKSKEFLESAAEIISENSEITIEVITTHAHNNWDIATILNIVIHFADLVLRDKNEGNVKNLESRQ